MITIIMPAYNEEHNISEAISSVLNQEYTNFEFLIVDDGSTDATGKIVEEFTRNNSNTITFFRPGKIGKNAAFNLAAKYAKGDWIYFMGADDIMPPNALRCWMNSVSHKDPLRKIAVCARMQVFSANSVYNGLILPKNHKTYNWSGPLTLMSKGMLKEVLPIPTRYPNEDTWWSLCIKYFAEQQIRINDIVVFYRVHDGNAISRDSSFTLFNEKYHLRLIASEEFLDRYGAKLSKVEKSELLTEIMLEAYRHNGQLMKIIFNIKCDFKKKARAVFLSGPLLHKVKKRLDRFMLGH